MMCVLISIRLPHWYRWWVTGEPSLGPERGLWTNDYGTWVIISAPMYLMFSSLYTRCLLVRPRRAVGVSISKPDDSYGVIRLPCGGSVRGCLVTAAILILSMMPRSARYGRGTGGWPHRERRFFVLLCHCHKHGAVPPAQPGSLSIQNQPSTASFDASEI